MQPELDSIMEEITAYREFQGDLEVKEVGRWVLVYHGKLIGIYDNFEDAANVAVERFGRGPYLIRQIGSPPVTLPASVAFRFDY